MLLQEKLKICSFSTSEKQIAEYMLTEQKNIQDKSISEISNETYTSKSTLVRLAKKLNYPGWSALKQDFLEEIDYLEKSTSNIDANFPFSKRDSLMTIANNIAQLEKEAIEDTLSLITHNDLRHSLNILEKATKIHVFAVSSNLNLIDKFQHKMKRIKRDVAIHKLQSEILFDSFSANEHSCAILISYSGETTTLFEVAKLLQQNSIPIILLTSFGDNTLSHIADVVLHISTREKLYTKISSFSTDVAIEYVLDVLYSCIFADDFDKNLETKLSSSKLIERDHFSNTSILSENK